MYPLSLEGIGEAVDTLRGARPPTALAPAL
jgi:hypothetical protein